VSEQKGEHSNIQIDRGKQEAMNRKYYFYVLLTFFTITLCGCLDGEPSVSDIKKSVNAVTTGTLMGKTSKLNKIGCSKAKDVGGYNCDIEMEFVLFGKTIKKIGCFRLVKSSEDWKAVSRC